MRFISLLAVFVFAGATFAQGILIDHTCADLEDIPSIWITAVQNTIQSHYAHTSHGGQLTYGVEFIEDANPFYDCEVGYLTLPTDSGAYCVFDGQETTGYVGPEDYWQTASGLNLTRDVLDNNPTLDTSMWSWCTQCNSYSEAQVQAYLDAMTLLEGEYPDVTFIYLTGNAQGTGSSGYNRFQRNNQIRDYCAVNDKVLFDFADLDCWWYNPSSLQWEHNTYSYSGTNVPSEHPQYYGDEYGHTTAASCTIKGKAWWWMMAVLAGWNSTGIEMEGADPGISFSVSMENPVTSPFTVSVATSVQSQISLNIYDVAGRHTAEIASGSFQSGEHTFLVDGLTAGVYFIVASDGSSIFSERAVVIN
ncbi:MAG: T9SS type A sorting domain-containing protein [Candidatus Sabulitectum sp.]|nr:T9SS type A sorting domain-containing protein [Candidatus Sabulitectum sp.]